MGRLSKRTIQCRLARKQRDQPKPEGSGLTKVSPRSSTNWAIRAAACGSVINFDQLGEESLLRYQQVYRLSVNPNSSREDLVWAVKHHFQYQQVMDESSLIHGFVQALRRDSSSDSSYSSM